MSTIHDIERQKTYLEASVIIDRKTISKMSKAKPKNPIIRRFITRFRKCNGQAYLTRETETVRPFYKQGVEPISKYDYIV